MLRKLICLVAVLGLMMPLTAEAKKKNEEPKQLTIQNQWFGKRVAYLGDSITDERQTATQKVYWQYLQIGNITIEFPEITQLLTDTQPSFSKS